MKNKKHKKIEKECSDFKEIQRGNDQTEVITCSLSEGPHTNSYIYIFQSLKQLIFLTFKSELNTYLVPKVSILTFFLTMFSILT